MSWHRGFMTKPLQVMIAPRPTSRGWDALFSRCAFSSSLSFFHPSLLPFFLFLFFGRFATFPLSLSFFYTPFSPSSSPAPPWNIYNLKRNETLRFSAQGLSNPYIVTPSEELEVAVPSYSPSGLPPLRPPVVEVKMLMHSPFLRRQGIAFNLDWQYRSDKPLQKCYHRQKLSSYFQISSLS